MEGSSATKVLPLRKFCRYLEGQRQKSHQNALEWQTFGRFTATVLQKEVENFERKLRVLQEKLDGLVQENNELREMCFYLDKSRERSAKGSSKGQWVARDGIGADSKKQSGAAPIHSMCAAEMNKDESPPLQYAGMTSESTLHDRRRKKLNFIGTNDPETAVVMLQKRVEKLESEKLELVKSLSAAHLLTTQHSQSPTKTDVLPPSSVEATVLPSEFQSLLESCRDEDPTPTTSSPGLNVSADMIMQAVTLLDMCRRLDALQVNGFTDQLEETEVATLRVLMSIAWQRLQENI